MLVLAKSVGQHGLGQVVAVSSPLRMDLFYHAGWNIDMVAIVHAV